MFAMYDDDGLNFRSTVDRLYKVYEAAPSQTVKNNLKDNQEKDNFKETLYQGKITKEAINKYKQVTNLDTMHEVYHVNEIMNKKVITVDDKTTIEECYNIMEEYNVQQLPIRSEQQMHLKGMITKHDILRVLIEDPEYAYKTIHKHIYDIATKQIITTDPISDIRRVAKVMIDFNLNAIPVVNSDDEVVGIVTRNNILQAISNIPHMQIWA